MPKEPDGPSLLSSGEKAIYDYLDEMLNDSPSESGDSSFQIPPKDAVLPSPESEKKAPAPQPLLQEQPYASNVKPLTFKEKPATPILTASDTLEAKPDALLNFDKPIVVQQPEVKEKEAIAAPESKISTPKIASPVALKQETKENIQQETKAEVEQLPNPTEDVDPQTIMEVIEDKEGRLPPMTPWQDNGRPDWAQSRFECLLFKVGGLKLAVPLVTLGAIHQIDRKLNSLPGQLDWFIGILQTNVGNIKIMDTALCVMPEKYDPSFREGLQYVITLHGFEWGISCHEILKSVTLEPEDVKWRTQRGKRPWLAGTVVDQMCALVDTAGFHHVIKQAEHRG